MYRRKMKGSNPNRGCVFEIPRVVGSSPAWTITSRKGGEITSLQIAKTKTEIQTSRYVCYDDIHDWTYVEPHNPNQDHRHECQTCAFGYDCDGG